MRPLRFLLSLASCIVAFFLLLFIGPWRAGTQEDLEKKSSIRTYFNWRTPSSLFPPSAVISLTDDNSTIFVARPANFGPLLPDKSMSGELWIGSGFGEDRLGRSGSAEGELGCSDVPGWSDKNYASGGQSLSDAKSSWASSQERKSRSLKRRDVDGDDSPTGPTLDDGTDDHLHHPLPASDGLKSNGEPAGNTKKPTHADIQSLQESAEIAGKIVLLSRGGCGFAEKVKWVQRRGGIALIVGDDVRGAPLVTMYARGDTSNVTIPSLFVSHTSAHLLSGLIPSGNGLGGLSAEEAERLGLALGENSDASRSGSQNGAAVGKPNFTSTTTAVKSSSTPKAQLQDQSALIDLPLDEDDTTDDEPGWFGSFFGRRSKNPDGDNRRPPDSDHIGWVLQQEFDDEDDGSFGGPRKQSTTSTSSTVAAKKTPDESSGDGFVIGVQDWRDPDLVAYQKEQRLASGTSSTSTVVARSSKAPSSGGLKGGSITPGSGEYAKPLNGKADASDAGKSAKLDTSQAKEQGEGGTSGSWFGRFFASEEDQTSDSTSSKSESKSSATSSRSPSHQHNNNDIDGGPELHEGLWVTLTPTSMSSSPFFDTLLVLVVSPLVTLTVVYALLLLRARIRRRRWRAPKSVVERLPVRTYQTMPSTTTTTSSTTSSISSEVTSSTPLLPSSARPINARPRPRSRTTSGVPFQQSSSVRSDSIASPSPDQIEEKRAAGLSEWRKRYGGKQRECVVCLEEYEDGVSKVMSLPCGHEFHAECMYVYIQIETIWNAQLTNF